MPFPSPGHVPDPGVKPVSPALAGGFFTTEPPGKPRSRGHCVQLFEELFSVEEAPFSAPAAPGLGFSVLTETAFAVPAAGRVQGCFLLVLIAVSLITSDVGTERRRVLVGCLYVFLGEGLVRMRCPFSHECVLFCFCCYRVAGAPRVFWIQVSYQMRDLQVLPPALGVVFLLPWWCALKPEALHFDEVRFVCSFLLFLVFSVTWKNLRANPGPVLPANAGSHA